MPCLTLDLRALPPPQPLQRILETLDRREGGLDLRARTPCWPGPLLDQLDHRGLTYTLRPCTDGSVWVRVRADAMA